MCQDLGKGLGIDDKYPYCIHQHSASIWSAWIAGSPNTFALSSLTCRLNVDTCNHHARV